jgi:putative PIN family toxin of toxin-antitoxin system
MRAVLDSTVLISAFMAPRGLSDELLRLAAEGRYVLVLADEIVVESESKLLTGRNIRRKSQHSDNDVREYAEALRELAEMVLDLPVVRGVVRDPNDDMVIACALKGQADRTVTRDKDLLVLRSYQRTAIVTPEEFRRELRHAE